MHALSEWFTKNPVAANLLMLLILIGGYFTSQTIRIEGFPALPPSSITITTIYPGANAEQVDRGVTRKIENVLKGMGGVKKMRSQSFEGMSTVWVQKTSDTDIDRFQNEIKTRVDAIFNMPRLAERPVIARDEFTISALILQMYGELDEVTLQKAAKLVKQRLLDHPQISRLQLYGVKENEIRLEVNEEKLASLNLSLMDVAQKINSSSLDYRTGKLKSENGTLLIRSDFKAFQYEEFLNIPIITNKHGASILLKDVADIVDKYEEVDGYVRYQGKPTTAFEIYTSKKGHLMEVSKACREVLAEVQKELPAEIKFDIWGEASVYMKDRLNLLRTNAWQGLLIVFFLLAIFLNVRLAFWVAMGIPISVAATIFIMGERFLDYSLNEITTFGLILVLGILVDDAVVVGESVFSERKKSKDRIKGTVNGVHKVATATIFGAFTTIAAFYPLTLIDNEIAKIFASFAVVVVVAILVSLAESKFILPAHLAAIKTIDETPKSALGKAWNKFQNTASKGLDFVIDKLYAPFLARVLKHQLSFLMAFITIAVVGIALIFNGQVRTVFFPQIPGQMITIDLKMKSGSPLRLTMDHVKRLEKSAHIINDRVMQEKNAKNPPIIKLLVALENNYEATVFAELQPEDKKEIETMKILDLWRKEVGSLEGIEKLNFSGTMETGGGFNLELISPDRQILEKAGKELKEHLAFLGGVHDVTNNLSSGAPQFRLSLKPEAAHMGFNVEHLAGQLGNAFGGLEIQRIQRGLDDVRVKVNYQRDTRKHIEDLLNSRIQNNHGDWIQLTSIVDIKLEAADASVNRVNGLLTAEIKANLNKKLTSADKVFASAQYFFDNNLANKYPSLKLKAGGELEEMGDLRRGMRGTFVIIILLIFTLLAIPLKSYWQPLVIMSVIPFGFVGAVFGHLLTGFPLSLLSFFGMLAVMGIVVNDSLVMITRFNEFKDEGMPVNEALKKAGSSRFRAIFLTTVTTVCGLMPLMLETSEQAQYLIPAAISLAFGEIFATIITLLVIPLLLSLSYEWKRKLKPIFQFIK